MPDPDKLDISTEQLKAELARLGIDTAPQAPVGTVFTTRELARASGRAHRTITATVTRLVDQGHIEFAGMVPRAGIDRRVQQVPAYRLVNPQAPPEESNVPKTPQDNN